MNEDTLKVCRSLITGTFIFMIGTPYYFAVLYLSRDRPTIYLDTFHVSSLNKASSNSLTNTTTIYIDLMIKNENSGAGIYYDNPLNLTITYIPPTIATTTTTDTNNVIIAKRAIRGFYQGYGKVKRVKASVLVKDLFSESEQQHRKPGKRYFPVVGPVKVVVFKVDLDAQIKFTSIANKLDVVVGGVVEVNGDTGSFLQKKSIHLKYVSGSNKWGVVQWLLFLPFCIFFFIVSTIGSFLILIVLNLLGY